MKSVAQPTPKQENGTVRTSNNLTYSATYSDLEALQQNAQGWDCRYDQIGQGHFAGALLFSEIGTIQFSRVYWNRKVLFRGRGLPGAFAIEFPLAHKSDPRRFNETKISNNHLVFNPPDKAGDFLPSGDRHSIVVAIQRDHFLETMAALSGQTMDPEVIRYGAVALPYAAIVELRQSSLHYAQIVEHQLKKRTSAENVLVPAADQLGKLLIMKVSQACENVQSPRRADKSANLVGAAEELIRASNDPTFGLTDICKGLGVSLRTLNYAFLDATGEPPAKWLRIRRLNAVRRNLLSALKKNMLVKEAALTHGFFHLGRFSSQYKTLFGEFPSDTIAPE